MNTRLLIAAGAIALGPASASAALAGPPVSMWPRAHPAGVEPRAAPEPTVASCDRAMMQSAAAPCMSPPAKPDAAG